MSDAIPGLGVGALVQLKKQPSRSLSVISTAASRRKPRPTAGCGLMPEHQEFGVLGHLAQGQRRQAAQQAANKQVSDDPGPPARPSVIQ